MSDSKYHIVYAGGDRGVLCVVEICFGLEHELSDYAVASRNSFYERKDAVELAKTLAKAHGITYRHDSRDEPDYLD